MFKYDPNTFVTFLQEWNKQIMLNFHITLISPNELHLRWSTSSIPPQIVFKQTYSSLYARLLPTH